MGIIAEELGASCSWLECLRESARQPLPGPEWISLDRLIDLGSSLGQIEVATGLLETASTLLVATPCEVPTLKEAATFLGSEFFEILGKAGPVALFADEFLGAAQQALALGEPVSAPSLLGACSLWACPILLHFGGGVHGKGAVVSFAFPLGGDPPVRRLVESFPDLLGPHAGALARAAQIFLAAALPPFRLALLRRHFELLARSLSEEISARYEALLAFQGLEAQGEILRRQHLELGEQNRVLASLTRQYAVETVQVSDDREVLEQQCLQAEAATCELQQDLDRLQAELRWREELFREVSHDLKAPLTTIRAFAEILGTLDETERDQARDFQRIIKEEAERLAVLVDQVLDLARLEAGHGNLSPEPAHPAELLGQVSRLFQARLRESGLSLSTEVSPDLPQVAWDRDGILRVLINLVDNALRFVPPAGKVVLRAYPASESGARAVFLEVEDNGPGIPEEKREQVFQRFYTAPPEHGKHRGTGLGLAICQGIAEAHGGTISVQQGQLGGALFRLRLPLGTD